MLIRHDVSAYNVLRKQKETTKLYKLFLFAFDKLPNSFVTRILARLVSRRFALPFSDEKTPLVDTEAKRAEETGRNLREMCERGELTLPDIIFVSPYVRTWQTFEGLKRGWPELANVKVKEEERIREQEHGLSNLYNDGKVFHALHPHQRRLAKNMGSYWYRYPQGENVPDVRMRNRSWITTVSRDFADKGVLAVTHHLNKLSIRANQERLSAEEFLRLDKEEKPINCGVTLYRGKSDQGSAGRLVLDFYNRQMYKDKV
jgi:broad specificity phosphatase PhoE